MRGFRGGHRDPDPHQKIHKDTGFLSNTGPDPQKNHKAAKPAFNDWLHLPASKTPFKWRFSGGQMMARLLW